MSGGKLRGAHIGCADLEPEAFRELLGLLQSPPHTRQSTVINGGTRRIRSPVKWDNRTALWQSLHR